MSWPVAPINTLEYLKKDHIEESQKLQMGYYRDLIYQFGIPVKYYKHNTTYLKAFRPDREDYVRGENPHLEYQTSADLMAYVQVDNSIVQLTSLGLQTNDNFKVSFLINEFDYAFSQWLGESTSITGINEVFQISANGFSANVSAEYGDEDEWLFGTVSGAGGIVSLPSGTTSGSFQSQFHSKYPIVPINTSLYLKNYYDAVKIHTSNFQTNYVASIDASGNGIVSGNISGQIEYNKYSDFSDFRKRIRPEVGDIVRIEIDGIYEDIEITQVLERRPTSDGLNPLLKRYIWQLDAVRREVSHEDMIGQDDQEKSSQIDIIDKQRGMKEYVSDVEFDYVTKDADDIDKRNSDRMYGSYGKYNLSLSGDL